MATNELENLVNPTSLMRPAPFWSWNDKLDESELRRQIREMAAKGWGSYFMHSRVGLVTGYLSDEWMRLINACADEAARTGTRAWIYDEDKWPSGFASGEVPLKDEKYRSHALVLLKKGSATANDTVLCSLSQGGVDYEICKRVSPLGDKWFNGACYVDLMNPEAVREFINCTHERYKSSCGEHFGKAISGIFTDEPCYLMANNYDAPVVPWSEYLPGFFKGLKGYDITERLPLLFFDLDGYRKARFDFYDAATELFKESFTKQYYDWCDANGLIMTGHFIIEESLRDQTQWSGDVMAQYEFMHWPGIDKLGRHIEQVVTCKQLSSVVDQLGKDRAFCEVYGCVGGQVSFFHRKWIGDWQAALGISFVNSHLSHYSMRGERKRDYPANLFYQQPWWEDERGFADYQGRLCAAVSEGKRLVDILVVQPLTSVWSEYSPLHKDSGYAAESVYDRPFDELSRALLAAKLDFHYGNETIMAGHGAVEDAKLKVGEHAYGCVIVPPCSNLRSGTVSLLREFSAAGGKLAFISSVPSLVDGSDSQVAIPGAVVLPTLADAISWANGLFPERVGVTDRLTGADAPSVYVHSRSVSDSTRHLFVNTDEKREVRARVHIPGCGEAAVFDLFSGSLYQLNLSNGEFDIVLAPAGSLLVITGAEAKQAEPASPKVLGSGASFDEFAADVPEIVIDRFDCEALEENVLLLNDFALDLNGEKVYEGPVCGSWHTHFYPAPDGTSFGATYTLHSDCDLDGCFAAIEVAENLESITFNGEPVKPMKTAGELGAFDPDKSWKDINFTKVPLPRICKGANHLVISGRKCNNITDPCCHVHVDDWKQHRATEAEEVYVCGDFAVRQLSEGRYGLSAPTKSIGKNLTMEGYPFYCGRVRLHSEFELGGTRNGGVYLQLNGVEAARVRVSVNGHDCGTLRWKPYTLDISSAARSGRNTLELELATTLVNAFGPNRTSGIKDDPCIGPLHFVDMSRFKSQYELFDFGVMSAGIFRYIDGGPSTE